MFYTTNTDREFIHLRANSLEVNRIDEIKYLKDTMKLVGGVVVEEKGQTRSDLPHRVTVTWW